jgi:hypothetical protein
VLNPDADTFRQCLASNPLVFAQRANVHSDTSRTHVVSQCRDLRRSEVWCWVELKQQPCEFFTFLDRCRWIRRKVIHFFRRCTEDGNDALKWFDRDIALAPFEPFDRAFADVDRSGKRFLRVPAALPEFPKIDCDGLC